DGRGRRGDGEAGGRFRLGLRSDRHAGESRRAGVRASWPDPAVVHKMGGYRMQGKTDDAAARLREQAQAVTHAGAELLVLESIPEGVAGEITRAVEIPTIGIGAGAQCDGQVLVCYDLLGLTPGRRPKFSKDFLE